MPILTCPRPPRLDGTDAVASSLRSVLGADALVVRTLERQAEIRRLVVGAHFGCAEAGPARRRSRGLRRVLATALIGLVRRFAPDVVSEACA